MKQIRIKIYCINSFLENILDGLVLNQMNIIAYL